MTQELSRSRSHAGNQRPMTCYGCGTVLKSMGAVEFEPNTWANIRALIFDAEHELAETQRQGIERLDLMNALIEKVSTLAPPALAAAIFMEAKVSARSAVALNDLIEGLRYVHLSTAPDGQWADQAVHGFVGAMLKNAAPQVFHASNSAANAEVDGSLMSISATSEDKFAMPAGAAPVSAVAAIKIPTDTVEQEFAAHERRGYERGKSEAARSAELSPMSKLNLALFVEQWERLCTILGVEKISVIDAVNEVERRLKSLVNAGAQPKSFTYKLGLIYCEGEEIQLPELLDHANALSELLVACQEGNRAILSSTALKDAVAVPRKLTIQMAAVMEGLDLSGADEIDYRHLPGKHQFEWDALLALFSHGAVKEV